jgi:hypothetical protein
LLPSDAFCAGLDARHFEHRPVEIGCGNRNGVRQLARQEAGYRTSAGCDLQEMSRPQLTDMVNHNSCMRLEMQRD